MAGYRARAGRQELEPSAEPANDKLLASCRQSVVGIATRAKQEELQRRLHLPWERMGERAGGGMHEGTQEIGRAHQPHPEARPARPLRVQA
eukprot:6193513-Pleurochrysis_carterae.AAC.2